MHQSLGPERPQPAGATRSHDAPMVGYDSHAMLEIEFDQVVIKTIVVHQFHHMLFEMREYFFTTCDDA